MSAMPFPRAPTRISRFTSRLRSFNISKLKAIPEEIYVLDSNRPVSPTVAAGAKRRGRSIDQNIGRQHKRQKEGNEAKEAITTLTLDDIQQADRFHTWTCPSLSFASDAASILSCPDLPPTSSSTNGASSPNWPLTDSSATESSSTTSVSTAESDLQRRDSQTGYCEPHTNPSYQIRDPVIEPTRLQRILESVGIEWQLDVVSRCLRKDFVFRISTPPAEGSLPAEAYSAEHITRVKIFAQFLFASSILDDAFPLFLQVWIKCRGDAGYSGTKALIQCARSAVREDDTDLIRALLVQEISSLKGESLRSDLISSLARLELSQIFHRQGKRDSCNLLYDNAMLTCPSKMLCMNLLSAARWQVPGHIGPDRLSCAIVEEAFQLVDSDDYYETLTCHEERTLEEYTPRDVLLAVICLSHHEGRSEASSGILHLRRCLEHTVKILQRRRNLQYLGLEKIDMRSSSDPRDVYLTVFFGLLMNWSARSYPYECLKIEHENAFTGMSTLEIISVIAFLALDGNNIPGLDNLDISLGVSDRASALLKLQDDTLLLGFLWCFLKLSRSGASKALEHMTSADMYKDLVADLFKQFNHKENDNSNRPEETDARIRESVMTDASANPTIALSLSTSSTLSSMRRQSRMSYLSSVTRWSNRTMAADELVERSSLLSISDGIHSRPVSANAILTPGGGDANISSPIIVHTSAF